MDWLLAQDKIMAIWLFIGLVCSVIRLFFRHIVLFDGIALSIAVRVCFNQFIRRCVPCDRHFDVATAVVAAKYPHRFLVCRRIDYDYLPGGV